MSKTRAWIKYLDSLDTIHDADLLRVLNGWDIPLDENIKGVEAVFWLTAQFVDQTDACVVDGMGPDEWDDVVDFVLKCLRNGVVPHTFVHQLIARQKDWDEQLSGLQ